MSSCPTCGSPVPPNASTCPTCGSPLGGGVGLSQTLPPGTRLAGGKYQLDKVLGQGGFGITYTGLQTQLGQRVAIKELFPSGSVRQGGTFVLPPAGTDPAGWARIKQDFTTEGRTVARFNHPDIVRVFDLFDENGTAYLVMELLDGRSLGSEIEKRGPLPPAEVVNIAQRVLNALSVVHGAGMLHRDIKPDNIYLDRGGRIVLIDFGSAREYVAGQASAHTRLVTPGYAPLEQYSSAAKFGPYTDMYALGATLYHALTGHPPVAATDRSMGTPLAPLPPGTPAPLRELIERSLEVNIANRPQSVQEALAILSRADAAPRPAPQSAPTPPPPPMPRPQPQRQPQPRQPQPVPQPQQPQRRRGLGCGCLLPFLILGGLAYFVFGTNLLGENPNPVPETTQQQPQPEPEPQETPAPTPTPESTAPQETDVTVPELAPPAQPEPQPKPTPAETPLPDPPAEATAVVVTSPAAGATLPPEPVNVSGTAAPGSTVSIEEGGQEVVRAEVGADGQWTAQLPAPAAGEHTYAVSSGKAKTEFKVTVAAPEPAAAQPTGEELLVFAREADLLADPKADAPVVTKLESGDRVQVLQTQDGWSQVRTMDGQEGWLSRQNALPPVNAEALQALTTAAQNGGELELAPGVYLLTEPLTLTKETRLRGAGRDQTRLVATTGEAALVSRGANLSLEGLTVQWAGAQAGRALQAEGGQVTLRDVRLSGAVRDTVKEPLAENSLGAGLWLSQGAAAEVGESELSGNASGAFLSDTATLKATQTSFSGNTLSGVLFFGQSSGDLSESQFDRNGGNGLAIQGAARPTVSGSTMQGNGERGVYVLGEAAPTLKTNRIEGNEKGGLVYKSRAAGEAAENQFSANSFGISVNDRAAPTLSRNTIEKSQEAGLKYSGGASGTAQGNTVTGSGKAGVLLAGEAAPTLSENVLENGAAEGILYTGKAGGTLSGNRILSNAASGVVVTDNAAPQLTDNVVSQNRESALLFQKEAGGKVSGGTCESNGSNAIDLQLSDPLAGPDLSSANCRVNAQTNW